MNPPGEIGLAVLAAPSRRVEMGQERTVTHVPARHDHSVAVVLLVAMSAHRPSPSSIRRGLQVLCQLRSTW